MIGYIYAIKSRGYVKIGKTVDLTKRFCDLQCANPERLVLYDAWLVHRLHLDATERAAHMLAADLHLRNEWFRAWPDIFDPAIERACGARLLPPHRLSCIDTLSELERHISVALVNFRQQKCYLSRWKPRNLWLRDAAPKAGALPG
jgi:hypothetical protein